MTYRKYKAKFSGDLGAPQFSPTGDEWGEAKFLCFEIDASQVQIGMVVLHGIQTVLVTDVRHGNHKLGSIIEGCIKEGHLFTHFAKEGEKVIILPSEDDPAIDFRF
jgi:hypothetical protein